MTAYSASPSGEQFPIPTEADYAQEMARLQGLADRARREGKEVVVVMGVGFVGAVMAAIIADTVDRKTGKPSKFVIGCQRPSPRSYWKIPMLNRGESPVKAEDPEVDPMIARCVNERRRSRPPSTATAWGWPTAWWSTCSATTRSTTWATCAAARRR